MRHGLLTVIVCVLAASVCCFAGTADASFIRSSTQEKTAVTGEQAVEVVKAALEKEWIAECLTELGFSPEEIEARLGELTESELAEIEEWLPFRGNIQIGGISYEHRNGTDYMVMNEDEYHGYIWGMILFPIVLLLAYFVIPW